MRQGTKKEPVQEAITYHFWSLISQRCRPPPPPPPFLSMEMSGGKEMTAEMTHTVTMMALMRRGVRFRLYSMACVMDQ